MKNIHLLFALIFICLSSLQAQEGHKANLGFDISFGVQNNKDGVNNPFAGGMSLGYEYDINMFFGIEAGLRGGLFNQSVGYDEGPNISPKGFIPKAAIGETFNAKDVYKGTFWAPYIAPKIYIPIGYDEKQDRGRYLYIENRFSYTRTNLDMDRIENQAGKKHKYGLQYEIRGGYQYPIDKRWAFNIWVGYNTFDFSKVKPEAIKFKNATPLQIGFGINYVIKD